MKKIFLLILTALFSSTALAEKWTIAIDPGHGGKDPGAIGRNLNIYEKNVTISIARELKTLLDQDPNFRGVLTRSGDYYISVPDRSEIARRNKANYLVSIHADSSENPSLRGASVWVLSNRRANDEMGQWLEDHEKQSELLGGAGKVLSNSKEVYLNQTVLDLQFGHSQRVGYELGSRILRNFAKITELSRSRPQHASLGVLRSPDIPSVLVETGFLSNTEEEAKLSTISYRKRIAYIIYQGIVDYRKRNGGLDVNTSVVYKETTKENNSAKTESENKEARQKDKDTKEHSIKDSGVIYKVKSGDRLDKIAKLFNIKENELQELNQLKRKELFIGQNLRIPDNGKPKAIEKTTEKTNNNIKDSGKVHTVKSGDRLDKIAKQYNIETNEIITLNQLKNKTLQIGDKLKIPATNKKEAEKINATDSDKTVKNTIIKVKDSGKTHTVKSGDRLDKIAKQYNVSINEIIALNQINPKGLRIGEQIKIPVNASINTKENNRKELEKEKEKTTEKNTAIQNKESNKTKDKDKKDGKVKKEENPKNVPKFHTMEKDQTLYAVSRLYGIPINQILKLNPKLKDGKVKTGQKIQIKE